MVIVHVIINVSKDERRGTLMPGKKTKKKYEPYLKLKALRTEKQIPVDKLSGLMGLASSTYRRKENRYQGADFLISECRKISSIFNVNAADIFLL